jgi:hypothetical protein
LVTELWRGENARYVPALFPHFRFLANITGILIIALEDPDVRLGIEPHFTSFASRFPVRTNRVTKMMRLTGRLIGPAIQSFGLFLGAVAILGYAMGEEHRPFANEIATISAILFLYGLSLGCRSGLDDSVRD